MKLVFIQLGFHHVPFLCVFFSAMSVFPRTYLTLNIQFTIHISENYGQGKTAERHLPFIPGRVIILRGRSDYFFSIDFYWGGAGEFFLPSTFSVHVFL